MRRTVNAQPPDPRGHTLLEALAAVGVIGVVVALAVPALRGARDRAGSGHCASTLRSVGQAAYDTDGPVSGTWPTLFARGRMHAEFTSGATTIGLSPMGQSVVWAGAVLKTDALTDTAGAWVCPGWRRGGLGGGDPVSRGGGYWYSWAFFTDPALWEGGNMGARASPERWAAPVLRSETRHASLKVMFAENFAWHGNGGALWSTDVDRVNAVFADGHGATVSPREARPALPVGADLRAYGLADLTGVPVPFSSSEGGARGRDF